MIDPDPDLDWPQDDPSLPANSFAAETGISIAFIIGWVMVIIAIARAVSK